MKKRLISILLAVSLLFIPVAAVSDINRLEKTDTIVIDGVVYEDSYLEFVKATMDESVRHWTIVIHTNGGDAHATTGIINRIKAMKKNGVTFTTFTETKAFSAGGYIFLMGDRRVIVDGAHLMFHTMMQQMEDWQAEQARKTNPSTIAMIEGMDEWIGQRFREVTGCTETVANYFLKGEMPDGSRVAEGAQFMSALTAYNMNIATHYISYD